MEDVAAGGEAVDVLVGERAEVLVADGADRPCGGGHDGGGGGGGIQRGAGSSSCGWIWGRETNRFRGSFRSAQETSWREEFPPASDFTLYLNS